MGPGELSTSTGYLWKEDYAMHLVGLSQCTMSCCNRIKSSMLNDTDVNYSI